MTPENQTEVYLSPEQEQAEEGRAKALNDLNGKVLQTNLASGIDKDVLKTMGATVVQWCETDENSRSEWKVKYEEYIKLASQLAETKTFPWDGASNVKYPLLTVAAMQFAARAYQALIPDNKVVKSRVIGSDPEGLKKATAHRIERFMSYQVLEEIPDWEDSMDRLCVVLPIVGNVYKKTYYNGDTIISELVLPNRLVVNYYAKSIETASRKTQLLSYYDNEIFEQVQSGAFLDLKYTNDQPLEAHTKVEDQVHGLTESEVDEDTPKDFLECHCFWDLDKDGYKEPYIITVHKDTQQVSRVVARYDIDGIIRNEKGKLLKIKPVEYFTNFRFIPDPNSGVYALCFGNMLGPLNETANTLINQIIDAGTLHHLQSGFIAKGLRVPNGNMPLRPGEFRQVGSVGGVLKDSMVLIPTKEPSTVLFNLLGMIVESGQQVSATSAMMTGESPGQNQPFKTTDQVLRQGLQVYASIFKRIHRSLKKEFKQIFRLNRLYLPTEKYFAVLDPVGPEDEVKSVLRKDFMDSAFDVIPASDPDKDTDTETMADMSAVFELMKMGTVNPQEATKRILEARDIDDIPALMQLPEPQPDFDQQIKMKQNELKEQEIKLANERGMYQSARDQANAELAQAKAQSELARVKNEKLDLALRTEIEKTKLQNEKQSLVFEQKMKELDVRIQGIKLLQEQVKLQSAKEAGDKPTEE